jgi:hypothetical protein
MPWRDGTGPWWAQGRGWRCWRASGYPAFGRGFYGRRIYWDEPESITLTKEEQKNILEAELKDIEAEKQEIEKKLSELK